MLILLAWSIFELRQRHHSRGDAVDLPLTFHAYRNAAIPLPISRKGAVLIHDTPHSHTCEECRPKREQYGDEHKEPGVITNNGGVETRACVVDELHTYCVYCLYLHVI